MPPSSSSKPAPLPLAPDRAAISNKISLLLSGRTSLLKTLNPPSSAAQTPTTQRRHHAISSDDIEQLFSGPRPNEGVGYVPDAKAAGKDAASKEDRMLRGRLLGKGKGARNQKGGKAFTAESESDEEPGRSGLGKRKRPRREEVVAEEEVEKVEEKEEDIKMDEEKPADVETGDDKGEEDAAVVEDDNSGGGNDEDERERNKKEKKRKKRQREKQKQKQKQANSSS
ncbi:hypothetical protein GGI43DRAFT_395315 [Trichoderma evansii]